VLSLRSPTLQASLLRDLQEQRSRMKISKSLVWVMRGTLTDAYCPMFPPDEMHKARAWVFRKTSKSSGGSPGHEGSALVVWIYILDNQWLVRTAVSIITS
jgi:hypothetical protein